MAQEMKGNDRKDKFCVIILTFFFFKDLFIYLFLAASGLRCSTWDLR